LAGRAEIQLTPWSRLREYVTRKVSARSLTQKALEATSAGRVLVSLFLIATIAAVCITNLPDSWLRREALTATDPYLLATGLDQNWNVFAPEPRPTSLRLKARVGYEDGARETWSPPAGGDLTGTYWDYRWRKWMENVIQDAHKRQLWKPAAQFVARQSQREGRTPTKITLVRQWQDLRPPGAQGPHERTLRAYAYYELELLKPRREGGSGR
jgi:hypothetical protein